MPAATVLVGLVVAGCGKFGYDPDDPTFEDTFASSGAGGSGWSRNPRDGGPICPFGYTAAGRSCYLYVATPAPWMTAEASCEGHRAHLVVIDDADEDALIGTLSPGNVWLGLTDTVREGQFVWVTGAPAAYTNWGNNQPDDSGSHEDGVEWRAADRRWNDTLATVNNAYLCEFDRVASPGPWPAGDYCDTFADTDCGECGHACAAGTHCGDPPACR